jgi:hypothetical protein
MLSMISLLNAPLASAHDADAQRAARRAELQEPRDHSRRALLLQLAHGGRRAPRPAHA